MDERHTVSYTHLDVYKRQVCVCVIFWTNKYHRTKRFSIKFYIKKALYTVNLIPVQFLQLGLKVESSGTPNGKNCPNVFINRKYLRNSFIYAKNRNHKNCRAECVIQNTCLTVIFFMFFTKFCAFFVSFAFRNWNSFPHHPWGRALGVSMRFLL